MHACMACKLDLKVAVAWTGHDAQLLQGHLGRIFFGVVDVLSVIPVPGTERDRNVFGVLNRHCA